MNPSAKTTKTPAKADARKVGAAGKTAATPAVKPTARPPAVKPQAKPPAKPMVKPAATSPAKPQAKAPAKEAPAKARRNSREAMLARVEQVRMKQREEGNFDCFGRAEQGFCDQGECAYHAECLSVSRLLHSL